VTLKMTKHQLLIFFEDEFPQLRNRYHLDLVEIDRVIVSQEVKSNDLRPGGTVSGPAMFALADIAFYAATLARIGKEALTVTTNANINFMRKPKPGRLRAEARILKLGKTLSVGDVTLRSEGSDDVVAHATMTYSIPPRRTP
jgi:uncharacterized protein (TIGR00369 family)